MYLKRLEMTGFKSFANRTELEFVPGVTAVVGPNGSGKSNVTDGIRWVLGEQSAKSLRGSSMQDVIFSGSDSRKPVGYCEVAITLDNTDQKLNLDYSDVTVTRRVYRSGDSEYYINKQSCRLKDITELFMDTGIGKEAYSMIGQGRIDEILSTKSEDRRAIFEEAAGIVKYKSRKREAERKLESTDQNLARIEDLVSELEEQVAPLEEQAEKAKKYKELKQALSEAEIGLYVHKIETLHQNWKEASERLKQLTDGDGKLSEEGKRWKVLLEELRWQLSQKEKQVESLQGELLQVSEELEKAEGQREVLMERARNRGETHKQTLARLEQLRTEKGRLEQEWKAQKERLSRKEQEWEKITARLEEAEAKLAAVGDSGTGDLDELRARLSELLHEKTRLHSEKQYLEEQKGRQAEQRELLESQSEEDRRTEEELKKRRDDLQEEIQQVEVDLDRCTVSYREGADKKKELEDQLKQMDQSLRQAEQKLDGLRSRREIVKDMEADHTGFFQGVKEVLKARDQGTLKGIHGAVAQLIRVPQEYEAAVETALGGAMQHLVVENESVGRRGIRFLKERHAGRATFLPLDVIRGRFVPSAEKELLESAPGFVGIAADLVKTESAYRSVLQSLLGHVIVARTLKNANEIARRMGYRFRIVTLEGDVVNPGGSMSGGSRRKSKVNLLGRSRQVEELEQQIESSQREWEQVQHRHEKCVTEKNRLDTDLEKIRQEGETLRLRQQELKGHERELDLERRTLEDQQKKNREAWEKVKQEEARLERSFEQARKSLEEMDAEQSRLERLIHSSQERVQQHASEKDEANREITDWKISAARLQQEREYLAADCERLEQESQRVDRQLAEAEEQLDQLQTGVADNDEEAKRLADQAEEYRHRKERVQESLKAAKEERDSLQSDRVEKEKKAQEVQQQLKKLQEEMHQQEVRVNRLDVELNHLLEKLAEEYEISYELARDRYSRPEDPKKAEREVKSLRGKIAALGEVNLGAIDEYERLSTRFSFLQGQRDDLIEAKESLFEVIHNIESEMSRRFSETFDAIRTEFLDVFVQMFGGGRADLRLSEPDNLLQTGIEIIAQPPGKKPQNLGLLSGGERALSAIALLFAVLRYKPVPFCVLDEVDAALDEANLTRFTTYLREFSQKTQFIIISHRKRTMEGADVLYGITMEEAGVSKLVSVKLDQFEDGQEVAVAKA
ncbi:chromosome segregation protein SMC [Paludifilum halophilum]|uniref:Chromosome partition protein Smc n=1 Tax=Paludifilum halophilum TaxID=1642702 RepID=A0A235B2B9_9BACL|nr:chromosome segregation protein SMC [Paludifilum halophilum]OYD06450.1 chromosome segregation protein SMC [Paludifilum halophilum]